MTNTLNSLLATATHPTTPDNEALNAIRALGRKSRNKTVRIVEGSEDDYYFEGRARPSLQERVIKLENEVDELNGFRAEAANLRNLLATERIRLNSRIEKLSHDLNQSQDDFRTMSALVASRDAEINALEREAAVGRQFRSLMALAGSIEPSAEPATHNASESDPKGGRNESVENAQSSFSSAQYSAGTPSRGRRRRRRRSLPTESALIKQATELAESHRKGRPLSVPFSEALRVLMHHYCWSQKRVADTFGVSTGTAFNISNGTYSK